MIGRPNQEQKRLANRDGGSVHVAVIAFTKITSGFLGRRNLERCKVFSVLRRKYSPNP